MKKKLVWLVVMVMLAASLNVGAALGLVRENAVVDGRTSDRVHLRADASQDSQSYGLYFSGTVVACLSDPNEEWVEVSVGSERGYMMSRYLHRQAQPGSVVNGQPKGTVRHTGNGGMVNMRARPSMKADVAKSLRPGDTVTVMGETDSQWYYVRAYGMEGYIRSDLLAVEDLGYSHPVGKYGKAMIDAKTADRVHLRESGTEDSPSMGVYFTGTVVSCATNPATREWTKVTIGSDTGYIKSQYLVTGNAFSEVESRQPTGVVRTQVGGRVNLRGAPSTRSDVIKTLPDGMSVTILGETHSQWYCVRTGGLIGYIEASYLRDAGRDMDRRGAVDDGTLVASRMVAQRATV